MELVTLIHPEATLTVSALQAMTKCSLFEKNPTLTTSPYRIQSRVSLSIFREFVRELEGNPIQITSTNLSELERLCEEFGFEEFSAKLSRFFYFSKCSEERQFGSVFVGMRNAFLRESIEFIVNGRVIEVEIAEASALFPSVREQLSVDGCGRQFYIECSGIEASDIRSVEFILSGESNSRGGSERLLFGLLGNAHLERLFLGCCKADNEKNFSELLRERLLDFESFDVSIVSVEALDNLLLTENISIESEDSLLCLILKLGSGYRDLLRHIQLEFVSEDGLSLLSEYLKIPPESIWECAAERISHPLFLGDSLIISNIPDIFAEFRGKQFSLLWRGSRDGFGASAFHLRCDGHGNTLTVIFDTNGNIFGGFTPVKWESGKWHYKSDDNQKSFLFTLKNPHNITAKRFALKAEKKQTAICCDSDCGPCFGYGHDIAVNDNCNANTDNYTYFDDSYTNDTGLDSEMVFTGSKYFQVKEIEVFEIIN
jgi:hypothetical protein